MIPLMMQENYKPQGWRESHRLQVLRVVCLYSSVVMLLRCDDFAGSGSDIDANKKMLGII